jgi:uncharacterized 2Fe-2S/4Fe-4S cluster protein (DUF4445 family)
MHFYRVSVTSAPMRRYRKTTAILGKAEHVNIETALKEAMSIDGALGVALVDWDSGMSLGTLGGGKYLDLEVAAAGNTEVVRAKMRAVESLRLNDTIEDILITLTKQYHLIRLLKNSTQEHGLFLYLALDRTKSNLALARHSLKQIESELTL